MRTQTENHPNNLQFKQILEAKRLPIAVALTIFNRGRSEPVTESTFKSWLVAPEAETWCKLADEDLRHAETAYRDI